MSNAMLENSKIRIEVETSGRTLIIRPVGVIDEDVNLSVVLKLVSELGATLKVILFDMGHVSRMNSCGVREWLLLMDRLSPAVSLAYENVSELFVEQGNIISTIFGKNGALIHSFYAPYSCHKCNSLHTLLLKPTEIVDGAPPAKICDACGGNLELDCIPDEYFSFLKRI